MTNHVTSGIYHVPAGGLRSVKLLAVASRRFLVKSTYVSRPSLHADVNDE